MSIVLVICAVIADRYIVLNKTMSVVLVICAVIAIARRVRVNRQDAIAL